MKRTAVSSSINLDNCITDLDNSPAEMTGHRPEQRAFSVVITDAWRGYWCAGRGGGRRKTLTFALPIRRFICRDAAVFTVCRRSARLWLSIFRIRTSRLAEFSRHIALDEYISDIDNADAELVWSVSGAVDLTVTITDRVASISAPAIWAGTEPRHLPRHGNPFGLLLKTRLHTIR